MAEGGLAYLLAGGRQRRRRGDLRPLGLPSSALRSLSLPGERKASSSSVKGIEGDWVPPDRMSVVTIRRDEGGRLVGRISWLRDEGRSAQLDFRNPDRSLRTRTLLGLPILVGFRDETRRAESGKIYDPATGWKVSGKLSLDETGDKLQVKGWVGLGPLRVSRSYVWSRNANAAYAEGL